MKKYQRARGGFTLLELLVVIAIIAIIGGALLVAYDGMEDDAASAQDAFNINAVDRAVRTFKVVDFDYSDDWDSLLTGDASASPFVADDLLDRLHTDLTARLLSTDTLTAGEITALSAIGITTVRDIDTDAAGTNPYDDDGNFTNDSVTIPNRIFDDAQASSGYYGVSRTLIATDAVATVDTTSALGDMLDLAGTDTVVALGLGNNNTMLDQSSNSALSAAPYSRVNTGEYGRYIALFQVSDASGAFTRARFLGIIDAKGNVLDEAFTDYSEGNN